MKTLLLVLLPLFCSGLSEENKIVYPDFNTTEEYISIYSIERTDTATILRGNVYNLPNYWVSISSGSTLKGEQTNKTYRLMASPEYETDKKVFMPNKGTLPVTLFFEPVDVRDLSVDYIENDRTVIQGLSLQSRNGKYRTRISGTVIGKPDFSRLTLSSFYSDLRVNKWMSIPIVDGTFSYELYSDQEEMYQLIFWNEYVNGMWIPFFFFSDNSEMVITCDFTAKPGSRYSIETDSSLTNEFLRHGKELRDRFNPASINKVRDSLVSENLYYTAEVQELMIKADNEPDEGKKMVLYDQLNRKMNSGEGCTPEGKAVMDRYKELEDLMSNFNMDYVQKNTPGLANYFYLAQKILFSNEMDRVEPYVKLFNETYALLFPENRFTELIQNKIGSTKLIQGGQYIDFTAPDLLGNDHILSELINDQVAIINLWASWCGPCRRHSMELIPVYEEFKERGLTIVGVARENKNTEGMEKAILQDKYPWVNLVELNDRADIWGKYGAGNGGGMIVMVNKEGNVIAINPTVEEVRAKLEEFL